MIGAALAVGAATSARAEEDRPGQWTLSTGAHYSTGRYGTAVTTDVWYVPLTVRYDNTLGAATLTVPYIAIHGEGEAVQGAPSGGGKTVDNGGLGDVVGALTYTAYRGAAPRPWLDLSAIVKFGTGDPDQELGTGKNDYALQVDAYQRAGWWSWFASLGYRMPGSTDAVTYERVFYASAGASRVLSEAWKAGLTWSGQQPATLGADPQNDVTVFGSWAATSRNTVSAYVTRGLTRSTPDWSAGVTFARTYGGEVAPPPKDPRSRTERN